MKDEFAERPLERNSALDSLGHEFAFIGSRLPVPITTPFDHRTHRSHAAVGLECPTLIKDHLAGTLSHSCEQAADHHRTGSSCDGFGNVTAEANAAVRDDRYFIIARYLNRVQDCRHLWNANTADHASGADRTGADANLDSIGSRLDQRFGTFGGGNVSRNDIDIPIALPFDLVGRFRRRSWCAHVPSRRPVQSTPWRMSASARP